MDINDVIFTTTSVAHITLVHEQYHKQQKTKEFEES